MTDKPKPDPKELVEELLKVDYILERESQMVAEPDDVAGMELRRDRYLRTIRLWLGESVEPLPWSRFAAEASNVISGTADYVHEGDLDFTYEETFGLPTDAADVLPHEGEKSPLLPTITVNNRLYVVVGYVTGRLWVIRLDPKKAKPHKDAEAFDPWGGYYADPLRKADIVVIPGRFLESASGRDVETWSCYSTWAPGGQLPSLSGDLGDDVKPF